MYTAGDTDVHWIVHRMALNGTFKQLTGWKIYMYVSNMLISHYVAH